MRRIRRKFRIVELYAGTARSIEPFRAWRRGEIALMVDSNSLARKTYLANFPKAPYLRRSLAAMQPKEIVSAAGGRVDVLLGCPPCQGFSESGSLLRCQKLVDALKVNQFDVSSDHSMFAARGWIDVMPRILIEAHYTVKVWATELQSRVHEYVGYHLSRYLKGSRRAIRVRPWKRQEIEAWLTQMTDERRRQGGDKESKPDGKP